MVEKIKKIVEEIETEKGSVNLFMLIKPTEESDRWTLLISANWIDSSNDNNREVFSYIVSKLRQYLDINELNSIGRINFLNNIDPFVQTVNSFLNVSKSDVRFYNNDLNGYHINESIIFESKKDNSISTRV